jgi:hypothetical protein
MKTRNSALYALGLAAAITLGGAVTAGAQAKKKPTTKRRVRSAQPIPIRKEVVAAKTDTVVVTRVDTVTIRGRTDTVTNTVMRYDTVTRMVYPPLAPLPGIFFGVGAGADIPMNNIRAVTKDGWAGQLQAGYFPTNSPFGIRVDGTYGQIPARTKDCPTCSNPKMWTVGGDVILRLPLDRTSKLNPVLYVFGGGGWANFSSVDIRQTNVIGGCANTRVPCFQNGGKAYWDVGPGVDFSVAGLHLYAEGRYMSILTNNASTHLFPVYGGIKFY